MSQLSNITPSGNRPWLKSVHEQRKERSIQLGIQAIDALVADKTPVTLKNIHEKSKELDSNGKGIHSNTIKKMKNFTPTINNTVRRLKSGKRRRNLYWTQHWTNHTLETYRPTAIFLM